MVLLDHLEVLRKHCKEGRFDEAVRTVELLLHQGVNIPTVIFSSLLQGCVKRADLAGGRNLHRLILRCGLESNAFLGSYLIRMFTSCRCLLEANEVFNKISKPNVFAWGAIISAHTKLGQGEHAIKLYHGVVQSSIRADGHVFVAVLKACADTSDLKHGKLIQHHLMECGFELSGYVGSSLIDMYAKCGSLEDAHRIFDRLHRRDVVTWCSIIAGYAWHGNGPEALRLFQKMQKDGMEPDRVTLLCILKACSCIGAIYQGELIHDHFIVIGLEADTSVGNALIHMYAQCGSLEDANRVFDKLLKRDVVTWGAMITGYVLHGYVQDALQLFRQMQNEGVLPDRLALVSILKACTDTSTLDQGKLIHDLMIESGFESDVLAGSCITDMYAKCGSLEDAYRVFECLPHRNVVSWNTIITGYVQHGLGQDAVDLYERMLYQGITPNQVTYVCTLKACSSSENLCQGKMIHAHIVESGLKLDTLVGNTLIDMYAKCGSLVDGQRIFDRLQKRDVVTWGVMIAGFVQHEQCQEALRLFQQMQQEGIEPDEANFVSILKACSNITDLGLGKLMHAQIIVCRSEFDFCVGNILVDMYAKCGSLEDAHIVFQKLQKRDVVTYNAMIAACADNGQCQDSLQLFQQMQQEGAQPNEVTFVCILSACSSIAAIDQGKLIHAHIAESGFESDVYVGNTLVDMYAKCGSLEAACRVFDRWPQRDVVTWNAIIAGCAQHSNYDLALQYFEEMHQAGLTPDDVTFVSLLSACGHAGLVNEGRQLFMSMKEDYCIKPTVDHYNCMVDVLGRAGRLNEAEDFLESTPFGTNLVGWTSLLSHCKINGNVELGQKCFDHFINMDQRNAGGYVLMSYIYSHADLQVDVDRVEDMRKHASAWKEPGKALIEINNNMHKFIVGGNNFLPTNDTYAKLKRLSFEMKREGYTPCLDLVIQTMPGGINEIA